MKLPITTLALMGMIASHSLTGKLSLESVYSFFGKQTHEAIVEKEYELDKPTSLIVNNIDGEINVTTEWNRNTICMKAIKKSNKEEALETIQIHTQKDIQKTGNQLTISTAFDNKEMTGTVDYHFIIPAQVTLHLTTESGDIAVNDVNGPVIATTTNGNIEVNNTTNTITASAQESGAITIAHARGNIQATTNKGDITIDDATQSIIANTNKGNIITACNQVQSTCKIALNAQTSGTITLSLPQSVNATLQAKTAHGRLTSDHYITIKPFTTKLNRNTHKEFEKQVNGIIGTGEADIRLTSNSGNIKIVEMKTT